MVALIFGILITILAMVAIYIYNKYFREDCDGPKIPIAVSLFGLLICLFGCISYISTGSVGVKSTFGKVEDDVLTEGLYFKLPWVDVHELDVKIQKYENASGLETSTKDMQVVNQVIVAVNYQLEPEQASTIYRTVGENYEQVIIEPAIQESVKAEISKFNAEEIVSTRAKVSESMYESLKNRLSTYGINVLEISLKNFNFSEEYSKSIEAKAVASQEAQTAQQRLEKAKIEAEQKKVEAQGESEANKLLQQTLTKEIIYQQFIEKWDGKMPTVSGSGNMIDISSLLK